MTIPLERIQNGRSITLSATDNILLADGTLWSHAATLGTRTKGTEFCIDRACVENFVKVFTTGYPQKIPVDYNHASTSSDPIAVGLGYQGQTPKAGDVLELRGVFSAADFTGDLKAAAEKLSAKVGRQLSDERNFGLWMRWKPTGRALNAIKADEYTELSIAFDDDLPNNVDGAGQGPGLVAIALLNTPFLDDMLPVAASRDHGRSPADPAPREGSMTTKLTVLSVAAALLAKPIASEDDALTELSGLAPQLKELASVREYRDIVSAEFAGEKDPAKIAAAVRELRGKVKTAEDAAALAKKTGIKTTVDATIKQYEKALVPKSLHDLMERELTRELEAGTELEKTETLKTLKGLAPSVIFEQRSAADIGAAGVGDDVKLDARARELMETNTRLKSLVAKGADGEHEAYKQALVIAERELRATVTA